MTLFIELQYFPPINVYFTLIKSSRIDFLLYENYQRRSFRNRCIIAGANGPFSLSVPIAGGRNQKKILKEVRIDYSVNWQQQHWRSISSAYGKSPWFFHYADSLEKLFSHKAAFLFDWNFFCLDWVNQSIGKTMTSLNNPGVTLGALGNSWKGGEPLEGSEKGIEKILDWRNKILPANFQNKNLGPFPIYTQVFEDRLGFQQNLSILDFVLCCGKGQITNLIK